MSTFSSTTALEDYFFNGNVVNVTGSVRSRIQKIFQLLLEDGSTLKFGSGGNVVYDGTQLLVAETSSSSYRTINDLQWTVRILQR